MPAKIGRRSDRAPGIFCMHATLARSAKIRRRPLNQVVVPLTPTVSATAVATAVLLQTSKPGHRRSAQHACVSASQQPARRRAWPCREVKRKGGGKSHRLAATGPGRVACETTLGHGGMSPTIGGGRGASAASRHCGTATRGQPAWLADERAINFQ